MLAQLRIALSSADTRQQLHVTEADWRGIEADPGGLVGALVEQIQFDGTTGGVTLTLGSSNGVNHED